MREKGPDESRASRLTKLGDAIKTGGLSLIYPEVRVRQAQRPSTRMGKVLEALGSGGVSLIFPSQSEEKVDSPPENNSAIPNR
jgi:hypothetical protein